MNHARGVTVRSPRTWWAGEASQPPPREGSGTGRRGCGGAPHGGGLGPLLPWDRLAAVRSLRAALPAGCARSPPRARPLRGPTCRGRPLRCGGRVCAGRARGVCARVRPRTPRFLSVSRLSSPSFPASFRLPLYPSPHRPTPLRTPPPAPPPQGRSCAVMSGRPRFLCGVVEGRSCRSPRGWCFAGAMQGLSRPTRRALRPGRAAGSRARHGPYPRNGGGSPSPAQHSAPEGVEPAAPGEGPQLPHRARMRPSEPQRSPLPASRCGTGMPCSGSSTLQWLFLFPGHRAQTLGCAPPASLPAAQRCAWCCSGRAALVAVPCSSAPPLSCSSCVQLCISAAGQGLAPAGQKHLLLS